MQHRRLGRRFSRDPGHRQAMFSNMAASLIKHEQIVTTLAKAKDLKRVMDKYITLAKRGDLNSRRLAASRMRDEAMVKKLFDVLAPATRTAPAATPACSRPATAMATARPSPSSSSSTATSRVKGREDKERAEAMKEQQANA